MLPFFPYIANQAHNGAPNVSLSQQVTGNSGNGMPNFMPIQGQSQVGFTPNPQNPTPFNNRNPNLGSVQNDHLGKSLLGSAPGMPHAAQQTHGGFGLQNLNAATGFPLNGSLANLVAQNLISQQLLANGSMGALNPNACFMNPQLALQNQLQCVNQLLNIALSNPSQLSPLNPMVGGGNQVAQGVIPQSNPFLGNPQLGLLQPNGVGQQVNLGQQSLFPSPIDGNVLKQFPVPNQHMQMNSLAASSSTSSLPHNSQYMNSQGTQGNRNRMNVSTPNHRQNKNFKRDRGGASSWRDRSQKVQNQYPQKMNGKHKFSNERREKGNTKDGGTESSVHNSTNDSEGIKHRSLVIQYSDKEIQQWREERRKYYPTKANVEKKQIHDGKSSGDAEQESKLRREQLKNVLAKQAELGFEVPEIPPHYLSDAEGKQHGRDWRKRPFKQNERFPNRFNRKGRFDHRERFSKARGTGDQESFGKRVSFPSKMQKRDQNDASNFQLTARKLTLLEKLLKTDIKRDRCHLLQAFRFMVMNSFFQDDSKPLKFPKVIVKEMSSEHEEKLPLEEPRSEVGNLTKIEELDASEDTSDDSDDETAKHQAEEGEVTD